MNTHIFYLLIIYHMNGIYGDCTSLQESNLDTKAIGGDWTQMRFLFSMLVSALHVEESDFSF